MESTLAALRDIRSSEARETDRDAAAFLRAAAALAAARLAAAFLAAAFLAAAFRFFSASALASAARRAALRASMARWLARSRAITFMVAPGLTGATFFSAAAEGAG